MTQGDETMKTQCIGLVGGIQKFSTEDGPGIRTTVFLKGCPLNCKWCHNPELISPRRQLMRSDKKCIGCGACLSICPQKALSITSTGFHINREQCDNCLRCTEVCYAEAMNPVGKEMTVEEVMALVRQDKGYYQKTGGGLTISGGEMLQQHVFASALSDAAAEEGIGVVLDTSGHGKFDAFYSLAKRCSHILYDMKCIDDEIHCAVTGVSNLLLLENLRKLAADPEINPKIIMRMPLIHGINDTEPVIDETCRFYQANGLKTVTLLPYHELGIAKGRNIGRIVELFSAPPTKRLDEIREQFKSIGMDVTVLGQDSPAD